MSTTEDKAASRGCCSTKDANGKDGVENKKPCTKLDVYDWLNSMEFEQSQESFNCVEVRFKNNRKDFFRNHDNLDLVIGEIIAVEASPGHDIGVVSLTGKLVYLQMLKKKIKPESDTIKKIYRKAKQSDIEKWMSIMDIEAEAKKITRVIVATLNLDMKITDVEYQGDKTKAIIYYTADERVDFRELLKRLGEKLSVRIDMKQIGARQEASKLGGIGSCGRELCCSSWKTDFESVTTDAAKHQQLNTNSSKLTGQCGKLKCCLNYEVEYYIEASKKIPDNKIILKTKTKEALHQKTDVLKKIMWYAYRDDWKNLMAIPVDQVKKIMEMNARGVKPDKLEEFAIKTSKQVDAEVDYIQ